MSWLDLVLDAIGLGLDVQYGKRFGFGSVVWGVLSSICIFLGALFFYLDVDVLGVIGIVGAVVCAVCSWKRSSREIKEVHEAEVRKHEQEQGNSIVQNQKNI